MIEVDWSSVRHVHSLISTLTIQHILFVFAPDHSSATADMPLVPTARLIF